jgi:hypothetical protein
MRRHSLWGFVYRALFIFQWIAGTALATIGASAKADPTQWHLATGVLTWAQQSAWISIPLLTAGLALMQVVRSMIGPPWVWDTVHYLLDKFQEHVFEGQSGPLHHHRVTLFKYTRRRLWFCRWPWSGWLVPVERSGHTTRRSHTVFLTPDDADQAEGIAGQTGHKNALWW